MAGMIEWLIIITSKGEKCKRQYGSFQVWLDWFCFS
jgi:hypothetical protein